MPLQFKRVGTGAETQEKEGTGQGFQGEWNSL